MLFSLNYSKYTIDRLKKKTIDQKKAMENDLKRTITKTVEEMDEKISNTKNQMYLKAKWNV